MPSTATSTMPVMNVARFACLILLAAPCMAQPALQAQSAIPAQTQAREPADAAGTGETVNSGMGVHVQDVTREIASSFGLSEARGAIVSVVEWGSAAYEAGVQVGDIFLSLDGQPVRSAAALARFGASGKSGHVLQAEVWRDPYAIPLAIVLAGPVSNMVKQTGQAPPISSSVAGLIVSELTDEQRCRLGDDAGLLVQKVDGAVARAGIRPGDILLRMNAAPLASIADFYAQAKDHSGRSAALLVRQKEQTRYVPIRIPPVSATE